MGNKEIENEFYHFKEMFEQKGKPKERAEILALVSQIFALRETILRSEQKPDFYEQQGFKYNESTFDDLFVKKFKDVIDVSTESSEDEDEPVDG